MYKVAILYTGDCYNQCINSIKYEEIKGNIEVVGIGEANPYATSIDGYPFGTISEVLNCGWNYLLVGGMEDNFVQIKEMLVQIGVSENRILSLAIFKIPCFDFVQYIKLHEERVSIITCHCWGGLTYHTLKSEFLSPFINCFLSKEHFFKMLEDLEAYINIDLEMEGESMDSNTGNIYPIGRLGDVLIHFNHYNSFDEAKLKWDARKQKINWNNLFIEMFASNIEEVERFDKLPYKKKICFVPFETDIASAVNVEMFNHLIADDIKGKLYSNINKMATNQIYYYDVLKLLNGESDFVR